MNGLDTLTKGLFDYAGLFPPASLDLPAAMREAARAPKLHRPRLLGADLVVPLERLAAVTRHALYFNGFGDTTCTLAVVGVERLQLAEAVRQVRAYNRASAPWAKVVSLEVHGDGFPAASVNSLRAARRGLGDVRLYLEPRWTAARWRTGQAQLLALLGRLKGSGAQAHAVGLKVRCAGPTAVGKATLARLLPAVAAARIPLKATQGLHHPLPQGKDGKGGKDLGFLNLAVALRLLQVHGAKIGDKDLAALLREADPKAISFADGGVAWRGLALRDDQVEAALAELPFTIGSCSLAEPDGDLATYFSSQ